MEEILDQAFNENEKDETRINRVIGLIRLATCISLLHISFKMLKSDPVDSFEVVLDVVFYTLVFIVIIHNIFRALSELRYPLVLPRNNRVYILGIILIQLILIVTLGSIFVSIIYSIFEHKYSVSLRHVEPVLLILGLIITTLREIIYYQRATRLKRLKNTKP